MKGVVSTFLVLVALLVTARANAQFFPINTNTTYYYTTNQDGMTLTLNGFSYVNGPTLSLPATINGMTVTCVGGSYIYSGGLTAVSSIIIPSTVTNIGDSVFRNWTTLSSISILGPLSNLGEAAFSGCSALKSITITGNLTSIAPETFYECTSLSKITLPDSVASIGMDAFLGCTSLVDFTMPASLTNVGQIAFAGSGLTHITIPGYLTAIGEAAFDGCHALTNLVIPQTVTSIGESAFAGCGNLPNVFLPSSVTNIGPNAFGGCGSLTAINLDSNNPYFSSINGFLYDKSQTTLLESPGAVSGTVTVPTGVVNIGAAAFSGCSGLTNLVLPVSVTNLEIAPIQLCTNLNAISVDSQNPFFMSVNGLLFDKIQSTLVACPGTLAGDFIVPSNVTHIASSAFNGCVRLSNITFHPGITNIGELAFADCWSLTNLDLPDGVTSILDETFADCFNLTAVTFPASVTNLGANLNINAYELSAFYFKGNSPSLTSTQYQSLPDIYYLPGTTGWSNYFYGVPSILWNPQIQTGDGGFGVKGNQFGFNITQNQLIPDGSTGISAQIQVCTNLTLPAWQPLRTVSLGYYNSCYFSEPVETNSAGRFYRLAMP